MMFDSLDAQAGGDMGLARSGATKQDHVLGTIQELAFVQLAHAGFIDLAGRKVKAGEVLGLKVNIVIDDIALPDLAQSRGLAGTLFVHKIAGHLAEKGHDLVAVTRTAERVIAGTRSIGMSLDTLTVPGSAKENRIAKGKAELGLGIHGEPGINRSTLPMPNRLWQQ